MATPTPEAPKQQTVDVSRITWKTPMVVSLIGVLVAGAISVTTVWSQADNHAKDRVIHVDEDDVVKGGGLAYKADVQDAKRDMDTRMQKTLQRMVIACSPDAIQRGSLKCSVTFRSPGEDP